MDDGLAVDKVGPAGTHFRPGGSRSLPYFEHLPAFAPELLVLCAAALVAFRCSRVAPPRKPDLKRSGSSSSVGSAVSGATTPGGKRAGALAKQVHRAFHGGDHATVLCVWAEVTAQLKSGTDGDAPLELPALKLVVKAMLEGSPAGLEEKQIDQVGEYVEFAGMDAAPDAAASALLQATAQWQASHSELGGLASLKPLADRLGVSGCKTDHQVAAICAMVACYAAHGRSTEVDALLDLEGCPAKVFDEAILGYLKGPAVQVTKGGTKVRLSTAMDVARRLKTQGGRVSPAALSLLFEHASDAQVTLLFQEAKTWGPLPSAALEVVARQALETQSLDLGKQVALQLAGTRAPHAALLPLIRLFLTAGDGDKAAALFQELCEQHAVSPRTCTLLLRTEAPSLPPAFLDAVLAFARSRHMFDLPQRSKDTSETAALYAAAMVAFAKVPERLHIAIALDSQLSMLGLDRAQRPARSPSQSPGDRYRLPSQPADDITKSDCVVAARRVLQLARGQPISAPPGL